MTGAPTPPKAATSQGPSSSTSCWMSTSRCEPTTVPSPTFSSSLASPGPRAYLDHAGGAPVLAEVRAALAHLPEANAQSPHAEGRAARDALDAARDRAATAVGAPPGQVVFCSGGTEAVNLALLGAGRRLPAGRSVVTWEAEHQSVLGAVRQLQLEGRPVHVLPVDAGGSAVPDIPGDAGLVSLGLANNEVGTLQPVAEVARRAGDLGALLHLDCCQG